MILQALTEYYETLAALGEISPRNYATANVSFALGLAGDGSVVSVAPSDRTFRRAGKPWNGRSRLPCRSRSCAA